MKLLELPSRTLDLVKIRVETGKGISEIPFPGRMEWNPIKVQLDSEDELEFGKLYDRISIFHLGIIFTFVRSYLSFRVADSLEARIVFGDVLY